MKRNRRLPKKSFLILPFVLLLFGCAVTKIPMHTPVGELSQVDQNHGIIFGSVLIKGPKTIFGTRPRSWLIAKLDSEIRDPFAKEYSLEIAWGEEKIFVIKMPAGDYIFTEHRCGNSHAHINQRFTVQPGKTVYIGHLAMDYYGRHLISHMKYKFIVMDEREETLASAEKTYGNLLREPVTALMGTEVLLAIIELPRTFEKIWYRPGKKSTSIYSKAYTHKGKVTITKDAFEFSCKDKQLTIPYSSLLSVRWGELEDYKYYEWAILKFDAGEGEKRAAFAKFEWGGGSGDARKLYKILEKAFADYKASERK